MSEDEIASLTCIPAHHRELSEEKLMELATDCVLIRDNLGTWPTKAMIYYMLANRNIHRTGTVDTKIIEDAKKMFSNTVTVKDFTKREAKFPEEWLKLRAKGKGGKALAQERAKDLYEQIQSLGYNLSFFLREQNLARAIRNDLRLTTAIEDVMRNTNHSRQQFTIHEKIRLLERVAPILSNSRGSYIKEIQKIEDCDVPTILHDAVDNAMSTVESDYYVSSAAEAILFDELMFSEAKEFDLSNRQSKVLKQKLLDGTAEDDEEEEEVKPKRKPRAKAAKRKQEDGEEPVRKRRKNKTVEIDSD